MFRKAFTVGRPVARARLYSSGLGYHDLSVNGARASDSVLDPQFTDYSKTVLYTTADVTALLRPGENVLASELGSGKFDDAARTWDWGWHKAQWRATPRLRLDLYVTYTDGTEQVVRSDDSWRVSVDGPTRYDSYYLGETYDARRAVAGWKEPGFDDARWVAARVVTAPGGVVRAQTGEPSRVVAERAPGKRTQPSPGVFVYDAGQNLSGWATVRVRAPAGTAVEIFYSEVLENGRASTKGNGLVGGRSRPTHTSSRAAKARAMGHVSSGLPVRPAEGSSTPPRRCFRRRRIDQQVWMARRRTSTFESGTRSSTGSEHADWLSGEQRLRDHDDTPIYEKNA
jgi:alpha-L-rhamnosidase